jgi:hypothetical protein
MERLGRLLSLGVSTVETNRDQDQDFSICQDQLLKLVQQCYKMILLKDLMKKSTKNKILFLLKNLNGSAIKLFRTTFSSKSRFFLEILTKFFKICFLVETLIFSKNLCC